MSFPEHNRICKLFNIEYPVIQAGMIWASGWKLASAVSNAGGLGLIGSGSMYPEILAEHIRKCKQATSFPFGVNVPLLYPDIEKHIEIITREKVPIVFTSAGNPRTWTDTLKQHGIKVVHVVSSSTFAIKARDAGCDAIVAEGFEAGGHNGREETTTMVLVPLITRAVDIPVIAAGGIATGRQMLAAMVMGAEAVQVGTAFVATHEASSHPAFKAKLLSLAEGNTRLTLKQLTPVRLIMNSFYDKVQEAESKGFGKDQLLQLLGKGRAKKGMFEGDMKEGELEIGQVASLVNNIKPAGEVLRQLMEEFKTALQNPLG